MSETTGLLKLRRKRFYALAGFNAMLLAVTTTFAILEGLKYFKSNPTIIAVGHYHEIDSASVQGAEGGADGRHCRGILRFDVMNFEDEDLPVNYIEVKGIEDESGIITVIPTGLTVPTAAEMRDKKVCKPDLENKRYVCESPTGISLGAGDGMHLDIYEDHPEVHPKGQEGHLGYAEDINITSSNMTRPINYIKYSLGALMKETHDARKSSSTRTLLLSIATAIILLTLLLFTYEHWKG